MTTLKESLAQWVDQRLDDVLREPRMWGASAETVEFQVLQLLEIRDAATNPTFARKQPRRILESYGQFLRARFPGQRRPGCELVKGDFAELARMLRAFSAHVIAAFPAENPFETHELAVRLTFKDQLEPSAAAVGGYIDELRRAVRAVSREGSRRAPRAVEQATDYSLQDFQLVPRNGVPAQATVCLGSGSLAQEDFDSEHRVRDGFTRLLTIAEWAGTDANVSALPSSGREERTRIAIQARRLVPSAGVERVEIGGRLLARSKPVVFQAAQDARFLEVIKEDSYEEPFEETHEIRAIDLDRSLIKIGRRLRLSCSLTPAQLRVVTEVGVHAKVKGTLVKPASGPRFVVVEDLQILGGESDETQGTDDQAER